jgi:hypothetical protein
MRFLVSVNKKHMFLFLFYFSLPCVSVKRNDLDIIHTTFQLGLSFSVFVNLLNVFTTDSFAQNDHLI